MSKLTELDAVNQCLRAIGESKVLSLESGADDAEDAVDTLRRVRSEVLAKGWHENTVKSTDVTPDVDGYIGVGADVLRIDTVDASKHIDVAVRVNDGTRKLYNRTDRTFVFTGSLKVDIVYDFEFDDLEPEMQTYIAAKAAREFQEQSVGSVALDSFTRRREMEAWAALLDVESEQDDSNILTGSVSMRQITGRNSPIAPR